MTQGQRKIPVQYAKRIVGRRIYGGASTHIPLRVNTAGVIPIIFAQSIIMFPGDARQLLPRQRVLRRCWPRLFSTPIPIYIVALLGLLIIFFTYFYTAIDPQPGRPGGQHEEERRLHPGHAAGQADRRVHRPDPDAHHAAGRRLPGDHRGPARPADQRC